MIEEQQVVLVDYKGNRIGLMPKTEAHVKGCLHLAFSVFIFNKKNELLLQRRASDKYHSPNLWTNTCCSHPKYGEDILSAGKRRLKEEMGIECDLKEEMNFIYKEDVGNGLIEHEFDYILIGVYDQNPNINPNEVSEFKWESIEYIKKDIIENSKNYTVWFRIIFEKFLGKGVLF